jgi:hypothetical protein
MTTETTSGTPAPQRPYGRSLSDFEPLKPAEEKLRIACRMGEVAIIADTRPEQATEENTVRAGFLRFLLLGGDKDTSIHEQGVQLVGAWIEGELNLENTITTSAINCKSCTFIAPLILRRSTLPGGLFLQGSKVPGIRGDGLVTTGSVLLKNGFHALGEVRFLGAQIGENLSCTKANFGGDSGDSLSADNAVIKGGVFLNNGFHANGEVRLLGVQIGSNLECSNGRFDGRGKNALSVNQAIIQGSVFLDAAFQASGEVRLSGIQIGNNLECCNGRFDNTIGDALSADSAVIKGNIILSDGFHASGEVRLVGTQIGGYIECRKGHFDSNNTAFTADSAVIKGSVNLRDGFRARGEVRLVGTQIYGDLVCIDGRFDGNDDYALIADGMHVNGSFFFYNFLHPVNKVSLTSVSVEQLVDDAEAWGTDLLLDGFTYSAIIGGAPTTAASRLKWLDKQRPAMSGLSGAGADFRPQPWRQLQKVLREMGHTEDARQVGIAFEDRLRRANLIGMSPIYWWRWRKWLYRFFARGLHYGFRILTGYGYRPIRLLGWFFGMWLACAAFYWFTALPPQNVFAPSNPLVFQHADYAACVPGSDAAKAEQAKPAYAVPAPIKGAGNWYLCETLRAEYTGFSPLAYSLDVILPLVDLQQEKDWAPMIPTPKAVWWEELRGTGWKHGARLVLWAETLFGWLASLLLVAIVSGLTKRRED